MVQNKQLHTCGCGIPPWENSMNASTSSLYNKNIIDSEKHLRSATEIGLAAGSGKATVFFRADDIGVPSKMFSQMVFLFLQYRVPLCLAVVPAWLTKSRLQSLRHITGRSSLFCWHQHGWIHKNHEPSGKKQEFGESRSENDLQRDLLRGKTRLSELLGNEFSPVFTPPWNRCGSTALSILEKLDFQALSRSSGAAPPASARLPDIQVNVDLHTRKEKDPNDSFNQLLLELSNSLSSGTSGIMLHHQRMNTQALSFLEQLLCCLSSFRDIRFAHFQDLLG
jgi:hypothetical protein